MLPSGQLRLSVVTVGCCRYNWYNCLLSIAYVIYIAKVQKIFYLEPQRAEKCAHGADDSRYWRGDDARRHGCGLWMTPSANRSTYHRTGATAVWFAKCQYLPYCESSPYQQGKVGVKNLLLKTDVEHVMAERAVSSNDFNIMLRMLIAI